nr:unnamed protein product [Digitaria exilis]
MASAGHPRRHRWRQLATRRTHRFKPVTTVHHHTKQAKHAAGPPLVYSLPAPPFLYPHPSAITASPTPPRRRGEVKAKPRTAQQQRGRGKGEAWEGALEGASEPATPPLLPPYAEQKPASGSGVLSRRGVAPLPPSCSRAAAERRSAPGLWGRRLVSSFPGKEALACLLGLALSCGIRSVQLVPGSRTAVECL